MLYDFSWEDLKQPIQKGYPKLNQSNDSTKVLLSEPVCSLKLLIGVWVVVIPRIMNNSKTATYSKIHPSKRDGL